MKNTETEISPAIRRQPVVLLQHPETQSDYSVNKVCRRKKQDVKPKKTVVEFFQKTSDYRQKEQEEKGCFTFADLFAGIGGMRMGFEKVGGRCVFTSEWNKYSLQTYYANFSSDHSIAGDITAVAAEDIPHHDVLLAGFPCQPFSIAGVSKKNALGQPHGFECRTQGTLFFEIARILAYHQPAAFLLENVKNLTRHDQGKTFRVITETLIELGYTVDWRIIDAKGYLPQHRERIFIAGFRKNTDFSFGKMEVANPETGPKLGSILHPGDGSEEAELPYTEGEKAAVSPKYTLTEKLWNYLKAYAEKHRKKGNGFGYGLFGPEDTARTLSARYYKDGSEILIRQSYGERPRRLTPRECARIMGFDRPGRPGFKIPVSDTQAYRQFGNAVAVPVVEAVAEYMLPHILSSISFRHPELAFSKKENCKNISTI